MFKIPRNAVKSFSAFALHFSKKYLGVIILQITLSIISNYLFFTMFSGIINTITELAYSRNITGIWNSIIILLIIWVAAQGAWIASGFLQARTYPKIECDARIAGFDLIQQVPLQYLNRYSDGFIENSITYAADSITQFIQNIFEDVITNVVLLFINLIGIFKTSKYLGMLSITSTTIYFIVLYFLTVKYSVPNSIKYANSSSERTKEFTESLRNKSLNYIYGLQSLFHNRIVKVCENEQKVFTRMRYIGSIISIIREEIFLVLYGIGFMFLMYYLLSKGIIGFHNIKDLLNYNSSMIYVQWSIGNILGDMLERYGEGSAGVQLYEKLYNHIEQAEKSNKTGVKIDNVSKVEVQDVTITYNGITALKNASCTINKGEVVMLSGPSGSGKTSLVNAIIGINIDYTGTIKINDTNIKHISQRSLLNSSVYILQGNLLIEGTAKENIMLEDDINEKEVQELAERFGLRNIDKQIGFSGSNLSGGEKQRVSILRALIRIKKGMLVICDELTSNLDIENAIKVLRAIIERAREQECTVILIEHLLAAKDYNLVDRILSFKPIDEGYTVYDNS